MKHCTSVPKMSDFGPWDIIMGTPTYIKYTIPHLLRVSRYFCIDGTALQCAVHYFMGAV